MEVQNFLEATVLSRSLSVSITTLIVMIRFVICDRILENNSKSHMKSGVFLHVFNDISIHAYVFPKYFLNIFSNLSIEFHAVL